MNGYEHLEVLSLAQRQSTTTLLGAIATSLLGVTHDTVLVETYRHVQVDIIIRPNLRLQVDHRRP